MPIGSVNLNELQKFAPPSISTKVKILSTHRTVWVMFLQFCKKKGAESMNIGKSSSRSYDLLLEISRFNLRKKVLI